MVLLAPTPAPPAPRGKSRPFRQSFQTPPASPLIIQTEPPRVDRLFPRGPVAISLARLVGGAVMLVAVGIGAGTWGSSAGPSDKGVSIREVPLTQSARNQSAGALPASETSAAGGQPVATGVPRSPSTTAGPRSDSRSDPASDSRSAASVGGQVVVHAAGAVARPGVYVLSVGARAADAVYAAGGMTPDADPDRVNLATPLADGHRLYIPRKGAPVPLVPTDQLAGEPAQPAPSSAGSRSAVVDLNTATAEQLDALPGVGPATAAAIIEHRTKIVRFKSVNQLLDVPGIGEAKLAAMRKQLVVN